jgi:uncharacterized protein (TIGR00255 family)
MTGHGQGRSKIGSSEVAAEVRSVNNRHLKIQCRTSEGLRSLEPQIEARVRNRLRRGSIQLSVEVSGDWIPSDYDLRLPVIERYLEQCRAAAQQLGLSADVTLHDLLPLPGVVSEPRWTDVNLDEQLVEAVLKTVETALESLDEMRRAEGLTMARDLSKQLHSLSDLVAKIQSRAPAVVEEYKGRLQAKLSRALDEVGVTVQEGDLLREVLLMADKADIREELVRLSSHFEQFEVLMSGSESQGRKLDFLIQEMFRETNTIGSKASDAFIAQRVVDMKTAIEQMRELVQNVE